MKDVHLGLGNSDPQTPGSLLRKHLHRINVTQSELAKALGVSRVWVNGILTGRCSVSPGMALRLARVLGTSPGSWLYLQADLDLRRATERLCDQLAQLQVLEPQEPVCRSRSLRLKNAMRTEPRNVTINGCAVLPV